MPELRKHPLLNCWVIINNERAQRPGFTNFPSVSKKRGHCPFCEGNEAQTPPETFALRSSGERDGKGWRVRVIPNKFSMLSSSGFAEEFSEGIYRALNGVGVHEVVIETPDHDEGLEDLPVASVAEVVYVFRERFRHLKKDPAIKYVHLFKNYGFMGGGSLDHTHCQIVALPIVTKNIAEEDLAAKSFFEGKGCCIFCDMIALEKNVCKRVVIENELFLAFCPYAPRSAFETWIIPKMHSSHFEEIDEHSMEQLASLLKEILLRIRTQLGNSAYNFIICTSPVQEVANPHYHWRLEVMPQSSPIGGFERGTGFYVNPVTPEDAAEKLKSIELLKFPDIY